MQQTIEIMRERRPEVVDTHPTGPILVHRADIANVVRALLLTSHGPDFDAGVIAVATALGVEVRR